MQNRIYIGSVTTCAYVQSSSKSHLRVSTPCKILYKQWTPKDVGPLCPMITTKKLFPLLAMNPKGHWSLVSSDNNQEVIHTSCNEPKRRWSIVSSDQPRSKSCFLQWTQGTLVLLCSVFATKKTFSWKQSPIIGLLKSFL